MKYLTPNQVYKKYGYHPKTLAEWAKEGKIEFIFIPQEDPRLWRGMNCGDSLEV